MDEFVQKQWHFITLTNSRGLTQLMQEKFVAILTTQQYVGAATVEHGNKACNRHIHCVLKTPGKNSEDLLNEFSLIYPDPLEDWTLASRKHRIIIASVNSIQDVANTAVGYMSKETTDKIYLHGLDLPTLSTMVDPNHTYNESKKTKKDFKQLDWKTCCPLIIKTMTHFKTRDTSLALQKLSEQGYNVIPLIPHLSKIQTGINFLKGDIDALQPYYRDSFTKVN